MQAAPAAAARPPRGRWLLVLLAAAISAALLWSLWPGGAARAPGNESIVVVSGAPVTPLRPAASAGGTSLGGIMAADATPGRSFAEGLAMVPRASGGWVVSDASDAAMLQRHRLRTGDVLLDLDGAPLDPDRIRALGDELAAADAVEISFERDGQLRKRLLTFAE